MRNKSEVNFPKPRKLRNHQTWKVDSLDKKTQTIVKNIVKILQLSRVQDYIIAVYLEMSSFVFQSVLLLSQQCIGIIEPMC